MPSSPVTWEPAVAGPGCADFEIISPEVLVSSEALEVQPCPQLLPCFPIATNAESPLLLVSSSVHASAGWLLSFPLLLSAPPPAHCSSLRVLATVAEVLTSPSAAEMPNPAPEPHTSSSWTLSWLSKRPLK